MVNEPGCSEQLNRTPRLDAVLAFTDIEHGTVTCQAERGLPWFAALEPSQSLSMQLGRLSRQGRPQTLSITDKGKINKLVMASMVLLLCFSAIKQDFPESSYFSLPTYSPSEKSLL